LTDKPCSPSSRPAISGWDGRAWDARRDAGRVPAQDAIIHGARGIFYFPQAFNDFTFDNTSDEVLEGMAVQHALLDDLATVLQGEINPSGLGLTPDAALEAAWRIDGENAYFFVLNPDDTEVMSATLTLTGINDADTAGVFGEDRDVAVEGGAIRDDFGPLELHIYVVAQH
jgi:hypothetical protein